MLDLAIASLDCHIRYCDATQTKTVTMPLEEAQNILALLKEQEDTINELQNAYGYLQKQFFEAQDKLLKEQTDRK